MALMNDYVVGTISFLNARVKIEYCIVHNKKNNITFEQEHVFLDGQ